MTIFLGVSSSSQHPWRPDDTGQAVALELWDKGGFGLFHRSSESFSRNSRSSRISGSMSCHSSKNIAICYEEKLVSKSFFSRNWFSDRWFCCRFRTLFKSFSRNSRSSRISGSVPCYSSKNIGIYYEEKLVSKSFVWLNWFSDRWFCCRFRTLFKFWFSIEMRVILSFLFYCYVIYSNVTFLLSADVIAFSQA